MTFPERIEQPATEASESVSRSSFPPRRTSDLPAESWTRISAVGGDAPANGDGLVALVAHDLKPPLSALTINLDFAFGELPADESYDSVRCALDDCRAAAASALRLVADAMDVGRIANGELAPLPLSLSATALVERAAATYADEACGRSVTLKWAADDVPIFADADLMRRVIESLIEVTLRMSRPHGNVVVSARGGDVEVLVESVSAPDALELALHQGAVSPRKLFGLYFADVVMRAHGGRVLVRADGDGSVRFRVMPGKRPSGSINP